MSSLTNGLPSAPGVAVTGDLEKSRNRLAATNRVQTPWEKQMRKRSLITSEVKPRTKQLTRKGNGHETYINRIQSYRCRCASGAGSGLHEHAAAEETGHPPLGYRPAAVLGRSFTGGGRCADRGMHTRDRLNFMNASTA
jgi:hypothetical protein